MSRLSPSISSRVTMLPLYRLRRKVGRSSHRVIRTEPGRIWPMRSGSDRWALRISHSVSGGQEKVNQHDREIIRVLARKVAGIADLPVMAQRKAEWKRHNALKPGRP